MAVCSVYSIYGYRVPYTDFILSSYKHLYIVLDNIFGRDVASIIKKQIKHYLIQQWWSNNCPWERIFRPLNKGNHLIAGICIKNHVYDNDAIVGIKVGYIEMRENNTFDVKKYKKEFLDKCINCTDLKHKIISNEPQMYTIPDNCLCCY